MTNEENKFICKKCNYCTSKQSNYKKHLKTKKHISKHESETQHDIETSNTIIRCGCGKTYRHESSFYRHQKTCVSVNTKYTESIVKENSELKEMMLELIQTNKELQGQLVDIAKEPKTIINHQQNNFSMENFLNVQCKDAMNLSDFLDQIEFSFDDLLYLGDNGFINSIKETFIKQLKDLDQTKRPIHCTDKKRKAMLIKNEDKWHKDNGHAILDNAIDTLNKKQLGAFTQHSRQRPENFLDNQRNLDNQCNMILGMCSYSDKNKNDMNKKILKEVCDTTVINKKLIQEIN